MSVVGGTLLQSEMVDVVVAVSSLGVGVGLRWRRHDGWSRRPNELHVCGTFQLDKSRVTRDALAPRRFRQHPQRRRGEFPKTSSAPGRLLWVCAISFCFCFHLAEVAETKTENWSEPTRPPKPETNVLNVYNAQKSERAEKINTKRAANAFADLDKWNMKAKNTREQKRPHS